MLSSSLLQEKRKASCRNERQSQVAIVSSRLCSCGRTCRIPVPSDSCSGRFYSLCPLVISGLPRPVPPKIPGFSRMCGYPGNYEPSAAEAAWSVLADDATALYMSSSSGVSGEKYTGTCVSSCSISCSTSSRCCRATQTAVVTTGVCHSQSVLGPKECVTTTQADVICRKASLISGPTHTVATFQCPQW